MRKFFLFIFAALLTSNVFAYSYAHRYVDYVPDVGHYTWYHEFNEYGCICFYDKFSLGVPKDRLYPFISMSVSQERPVSSIPTIWTTPRCVIGITTEKSLRRVSALPN